MSVRAELRMHLTQALTRTTDADVQAHLQAAIASVDELPRANLVACPVCGVVGLPARIEVHECRRK